MMLYVNGQDIARLVLGLVTKADGQNAWAYGPEVIACGPEGFLSAINAVLNAQQTNLGELSGFVLVTGPGSPTALRASHAIVNTLAFTGQLPIVALEKPPALPDAELLEQIATAHLAPFAFPKYGSAPTITTSTRDALKRTQ